MSVLWPCRSRAFTSSGAEAPFLRAAFADVVLTDDEHHRGRAAWLGRADVLARWLGERSSLRPEA